MLPASAVPDKVRTFAVVMWPPTVPVSGVNEAIVGAAGGLVSGLVIGGALTVSRSGGGRLPPVNEPSKGPLRRFAFGAV
jgi:hypothetical protein